MGNIIIGQELKGVTKRPSPEWIMNMMLVPERMIDQASIAKTLFEEYGPPMSNMYLSKEDDREILEYFRSIDE